jgi:hypothetical protein
MVGYGRTKKMEIVEVTIQTFDSIIKQEKNKFKLSNREVSLKNYKPLIKDSSYIELMNAIENMEISEKEIMKLHKYNNDILERKTFTNKAMKYLNEIKFIKLEIKKALILGKHKA